MDIPAPPRQHLDVLFPSNPALHATLSALETVYVKARMPLAGARESGGELTMLSADNAQDDAWCVDPRGVLTLHLAAPSYQTLGITGPRLPFKGYDEHTVSLPPRLTNDSDVHKLRAWDLRREQAGLGPWPVFYCATDADATAKAAAAHEHTALVRAVKAETRMTHNMRVPEVTLGARPTEADAVADWEADIRALFEWVGLAGLGAQRLQANDRVDAYVAVYDAPEPSVVGDITHLRWRGFLGPAFVQSVIDAVVSAGAPQFVSITAHAFPESPVSYIPQGKDGAASLKSPARVPRADGEDVWCMVVSRDGDTARWCMAESIGPLDARWG
ncbi:ribonuclease P 40kDa subunit-domain-containing protein [Mycena rosella]|uniref:Ribonuclease P 40kDa subunit-domain-containing protein n=1 Tax=Mycena rosella TaxID=1033263 RepID=A0AAD7DRL9_MYCRO|nr:ribonuclease P 40kDa subunit-domain-containing protein [Mycena rosella]